MKYYLYVDGASRGNPGPSGAGAFLTNEKGEVFEKTYKYLGIVTNNMAEYHALLLGLKSIQKKKYSKIIIFSDSELLVRQIQGKYKVLNPALKKKYNEVMTILASLDYSILHIKREKNKVADQLANEAIDQHRTDRS